VTEVTAAARLRQLLESVVWGRPAEGILLSAGLDTSAIAALAHAGGVRPLAVTVCWDEGVPDPASPRNWRDDWVSSTTLSGLATRRCSKPCPT